MDWIGLIIGAIGPQAMLMFTMFQMLIQLLMTVVMKIGDHTSMSILMLTIGPTIQGGNTNTRMPST